MNIDRAKVMAFVTASTSVKSEKQLPALYQAHAPLFAELGWDVQDPAALRAKLGDLRVAACALLMDHAPTVWKGEKPPRASGGGGGGGGGKASLWTARLLDEKGEPLAYNDPTVDENTGRTVMVRKVLTKGFDLRHKAEAWAAARLAEHGRHGCVATIRTSSPDALVRSLEKDITVDEAVAMAWVDKRPTTAMRVQKVTAPARGRWMKNVTTDRSHHSKG